MGKPVATSTFIEHLAELRKRLILIFAANIAAALLCYQYMDRLIRILLQLNPGMALISITPAEVFMVYVRLAIVCAVVLCFPITATQLWGFIAKGLYPRERHYGLIALVSGVFFFVLGAVFAYCTALPITLSFFLRITIEDITPMVSVDSYISFCTSILVCFGAAFELPVVVFLLSELEILKPAHMKRYHGVLILVIFIIAAVITPPDVLSQVMLGIPMLLLLQLSMGICWYIDRIKKQRTKKST